jgi:hypothetical protein
MFDLHRAFLVQFSSFLAQMVVLASSETFILDEGLRNDEQAL